MRRGRLARSVRHETASAGPSRSRAQLRRAPCPVPHAEVTPESRRHGPVRPRSLRHTGCGARELLGRSRQAARASHEDHEEGHLGDPLLREPPLASLGPTLREGGEPSSRSGAQAPREHEGEGRPRARRARTADASGRAEAAAGAARALAREGDLPRLRVLLQAGAPGRPLRVRVPDERRRTVSTAASSRWARASGSSSATAGPHSSRRGPRTGTSSARAATGARGRASPRAEALRDFVRKLRNPPAAAGSHRARSLVVERSCPSGGRSTA